MVLIGCTLCTFAYVHLQTSGRSVHTQLAQEGRSRGILCAKWDGARACCSTNRSYFARRGARGARGAVVWEVGYASAGERTLSGSTAVARQHRSAPRVATLTATKPHGWKRRKARFVSARVKFYIFTFVTQVVALA